MSRLVRTKTPNGALPVKGGGRASAVAVGSYEAISGTKALADARMPRHLEAKGADVTIALDMPSRKLGSPVTPGMLDQALDDPNYWMLVAEISGCRIVAKPPRADGSISAIVLETPDRERLVDAGSRLVVANTHRPDAMARRVARIMFAKGFPQATVSTIEGANLISAIARELKRLGCLAVRPAASGTLLAGMGDRAADAVFAPDIEQAAIDLISAWWQANAPAWISSNGFADHFKKIATVSMVLPTTSFEQQTHLDFLARFEMTRDARLQLRKPAPASPSGPAMGMTR